jgi:hypothetical protein
MGKKVRKSAAQIQREAAMGVHSVSELPAEDGRVAISILLEAFRGSEAVNNR